MSRLIIFTYSLLLWGWNSVRWRNIMSYKLSDTHFLTICNPRPQDCSTKPMPATTERVSMFVLIKWSLCDCLPSGLKWSPRGFNISLSLSAPPLISNDSININNLIRVWPVDRKPLSMLQIFSLFLVIGTQGTLAFRQERALSIIYLYLIPVWPPGSTRTTMLTWTVPYPRPNLTSTSTEYIINCSLLNWST